MGTSGSYYGTYLRWTLRLLGVGVGVVCVVGVLLLLVFALTVCYDGRKGAAEVISSAVSRTPIVHEDAEDKLFKHGSFSFWNSLYFSSFDGSHVYENRGSMGGTVARKPFVSERRMFDQVREEVIGYLEGQGRRGLSSKDCKDIRYRVVAAAGMEVELICSSASSSGTERVVMQLPFHGSRVVLHTHVDKAQKLGVIVPLQGRVAPLERFLSNLLKATQVDGLQVVLTVIYFEDHNTKAVAAALKDANRSDNLQTQLILLNGAFSRSRALKIGVMEAKGGAELVFLCDVDILFTRDFLHRCLASPVQGHQVFFPVFFSQYNPILTYPLRGMKVPSEPSMKPADHHGYWRLWSFGMACLYKSDFLRINGFNDRTSGWGGEDLHFARRVLAMNYSISRSLDHGLFHLYHPKDCSQAGRGQQISCLRVQALSEASGQTFGFWYFKYKHNASIWGLLRDEEMRKEDVDAMQGREKWEKEPTKEAEEETEEKASAGILEDTLALQVTLLVMIVVNIVLCANMALTRACRCSCARQPQPDIG